MKVKFNIFLISISILITMLSACTEHVASQTPTGDMIIKTDTVERIPKNVIQIGEQFKSYPGKADGHLLCTVTDVRVVTEQSECPPAEWFDEGGILVDTNLTIYPYDEWFTEGGAFDQGCRILIADLTVTNVDAHSWLDNGTFSSDCGWFNDLDVFYAKHVLRLADLTGIRQEQYLTHLAFGFSAFGVYSDDIPNTKGYEPTAIRIAPGETVSYSLAFPLNAADFVKDDGTWQDLSTLMLCGGQLAFPDEAVFIDLNLKDR